MVLVLTDGAKLEMRSVPRFREVEAYIEEQCRARGGGSRTTPPSQGFGKPDALSA